MSAPSGLDPDRERGEALRAVALSILDEAQSALSAADRDRSTAIHDFRKEMKRWRALLRLMSAFLGDDCRHLRKAAGDLARSFTAARDIQSAIMILPVLAKAAPDAAETLSTRSFNTIKERLEGIRGRSEQITLDSRKFQLLSNYIATASERVNEWQLDDISFGALAGELAKTYRRGRRAMPADWTSASPEDLHEFRRRVIEHRYQMELLVPAWPRLARLWIDEAQRLRTRLGNFQDLVVLKRLMEPHQPLSHWRARLTPLVEARQASYVKGAARIARRLFAESPKAFGRRIEALWESQADR
jgi:CHAD domain-containing protein